MYIFKLKKELLYILFIQFCLHVFFFCPFLNICGFTFLFTEEHLPCSLQSQCTGSQFLKIFPKSVFISLSFLRTYLIGYRILGWHLSFHSIYAHYLQGFKVLLRNLSFFFEISCYLMSRDLFSLSPCFLYCFTLSLHMASLFFLLVGSWVSYMCGWLFSCSVHSYCPFMSVLCFTFSFFPVTAVKH